MNIIAIMGPTGVYYKDEPIRELHAALATMGFQLVYPKNSGDLLKLIEANARICGVIFDWDDYSLELCSEINELNEYLPLYAFINTHSTFDVSLHEMRMVLYFFEYGLNAADDIAQRIQQYTAEYIDTITPPLTKALFNYVREGKYTFCTPGHMAGTAFQKSPVGCLFYDFFGANTLKADISISVTELGSLLDHTGPHLEAEEYIARTFNAEQSYLVTNGTSTANKIVGMYSAPAGFDDFSGGLKMMAREVMDISEAREKYARGLAISLTDRQIDDQLLNRLRQSLEPHRSGTIPVHLYYQREDARAKLRFGATWRVTPTDRLLIDLRTLVGNEQVDLEFD